MIQAPSKRVTIGEQVSKGLELSLRHTDHKTIGSLRKKKDSFLKEVSKFRCQSFFKELCFANEQHYS